MSMIRIRVLDVSGSKVRDVDAPDDIAVNRIIALLVEKMSLPLNSPDGQIMSYKLHHRRAGQQLLDTQTLGAAGVIAGDELRLQPEITAGAGGVILSRRSAAKDPERPKITRRSGSFAVYAAQDDTP